MGSARFGTFCFFERREIPSCCSIRFCTCARSISPNDNLPLISPLYKLNKSNNLDFSTTERKSIILIDSEQLLLTPRGFDYSSAVCEKLQTIENRHSIYITKDSIPKLRNIVLPHIIPSMRYKLGIKDNK